MQPHVYVKQLVLPLLLQAQVLIFKIFISTFFFFLGITNTITALKNAQMAESPILLLGGGSPTLLKGSGALQVYF